MEVDRLAAGLRALGLQAGDRIALHLRNGPELAISYCASLRIGLIAVPLNLLVKAPELDSMLRRVQPLLYIGQSPGAFARLSGDAVDDAAIDPQRGSRGRRSQRRGDINDHVGDLCHRGGAPNDRTRPMLGDESLTGCLWRQSLTETTLY
jgi:acyl-CoA synthetase (AMP-forming)/AMP-acid ligase II